MSNDDDSGVYEGRERELLARTLKDSGMSMRAAAAKVGMSDTRLRHIVNGYQPVGRGQRVVAIAPEDTLARIAIALKITPQQLEDAGRPDAADAVRRRYSTPDEVGENVALSEEIAAWAQDPLLYQPPDSVLTLVTDSALLGEVQRRLEGLRGIAGNTTRFGAVWDHTRPVERPRLVRDATMAARMAETTEDDAT